MKQTLRDYVDDLLSLPAGLQWLIAAALLSFMAIAVFFAGGNYYRSLKIEKLQKENAELLIKSAESYQKMKAAETQAANEKVRADNIESTLKLTEADAKKQDEKIFTARKTSTDIRTRIRVLRGAEPKRADAADLERRLKARYGSPGQTGNAGPSQ